MILKQLPSKNFSTLTNGQPKEHKKVAIMLHSTVGRLASAKSWLTMTPDERFARYGTKSWSSAHIIAGRTKGDIYQLMPFQYRAWHGGGVNRRTQRALDIIGQGDPNNLCIGYEFVNYYDIDKDGLLEEEEKMISEGQYQDFIDFIDHLEELSKNNPWLEITADADHILTHFDTNKHKPNMEKIREEIIRRLDARKEVTEVEQPKHANCLQDLSITDLVKEILRRIS